ncbi:hypothetical protein BC832DRAFT_554532 [Gaertneriomyces semiglobifer]|nr:hypothetical protein BC832DRAFT_554532 [Gaertneriomyces semiglobifer]
MTRGERLTCLFFTAEDGEDSPHYTSLLDMSGEKIKFSARRSTKPSRPQRPSVSDDTASVSSINTATTQSGRRSNLSKSKTGSQASLTGKKKSKK